MDNRIVVWIGVLVLVAYGAYVGAGRTWVDATAFQFGLLVGFAPMLVFHLLKQWRWSERERAHQQYVSYVANTVSLVYLKHGPCPACGHRSEDDYTDGFGAHAPLCPILSEIVEFGHPPVT